MMPFISGPARAFVTCDPCSWQAEVDLADFEIDEAGDLLEDARAEHDAGHVGAS